MTLVGRAPDDELWGTMAIGAKAQRFERIRRLGEGGVGVVYEAFDREQGMRVALKTLRQVTAKSLAELKREFRAMQDVHHPNLVNLGELVSEGDECFFTMELIEGIDFLEHVRPSRPLAAEFSSLDDERLSAVTLTAPLDLAGDVTHFDEVRLRDGLRQLAEAIWALHGAGLVHRDVKPSNVRVAPDGRVVLLDFGLVVIADGSNPWTERVAGTPAYMAPEQVASAVVGPEADWYALGVLLFEALTGTIPFQGAPMEVIKRKQREAPPAPSSVTTGVPPDLDALSAELMRVDPSARPKGDDVLVTLGVSRSSRSLIALGTQTHTTPFVGRQSEMASLLSAFHASRAQPVTILVEGESGVGKTALVRHFLQRLALEVDGVVVLAGRCYERESVPYKAFDGVVDALARVLSHLSREEALELVPTRVGPLVKVFPVLRRVAAIAERVRGTLPVLAPHELRTRAFAALRDLFTRLSDRRPLVLAIDDAQWADPDSVALLAELMRPPDAPPLLLVMTARGGELAREAADPSPVAEPRRAVLANTLQGDVRRVQLGALPPGDANALATELLEHAGVTDPQIAAWSAKQAGGHPLFIDMMIRQASHLASPRNGDLELEDVLWAFIGQLADTPLVILETVCVADAPMSQEVVARAAGIEGDGFAKGVSLLRVSHMVQTRGARGADRIEPYHDRVRVAVLAHLDAPRRAEVHRSIALTLEATTPLDPESLVVHWRGAGDLAQMAHFAALAGDRADEALAFDRAATFYELALGGLASSDARRRALLTKLGEARANAGRGESAAEAFREAAGGASAFEALELRRREAEELMMAGDIDAGTAALHSVLGAVDLRAPRSPLALLFWLITYRLWHAVVGLRLKERAPDEVSRDARARVDALFAVSRGFSGVDPILSRCMGTRHLIAALRVGDTFQVLRAAGMEISYAAFAGGPVSQREHRLIAMARRLADREGNPEGQGFFRSCLGISQYLRGEFSQAHQNLDTAYASTDSQRGGRQSNARVFGVWTLMLMGEYREIARRLPSLLADADARGDLYTSVQLRAGSVTLMWLAADDPETARRHIREAISQWSHSRFLMQHWQAMCGEAEVELYSGNGVSAYDRCVRDLPAVGSSLLLRCQLIRIITTFLRGRCAVASANAAPALRPKRVLEARRLGRRLERDATPFAGALASLLSAAVANAEGDRPRAIASLRRAIVCADAAHMALHAAVARHQLGSLLGGGEGTTLLMQSEEAMKAQDVRVPARFAAMWLPGRWRVE